MNFAGNLDDLLSYTQGLIEEIQEKNKSFPKLGARQRSPSPLLNSYKQVREGALNLRASQRSPHDMSPAKLDLERSLTKISRLERQWSNQKEESSEMKRNSRYSTPLRMNHAEGIEPSSQQPPQVENSSPYFNKVDSRPSIRSLSAQRSSSKKGVFDAVLNHHREIAENYAQEEIIDNHKQTAGMRNSQSWKQRGSEFVYAAKYDKRVPHIPEVQNFLKRNMSAQKSSSSPNDQAADRSMNKRPRHNETAKSKKENSIPHSHDKASQKGSISSKVLPFKTGTESTEISVIEPKEKFDIDLDSLDNDTKLYSKRSSYANDLCRQGWILEEALKDEFALRKNSYSDKGTFSTDSAYLNSWNTQEADSNKFAVQYGRGQNEEKYKPSTMLMNRVISMSDKNTHPSSEVQSAGLRSKRQPQQSKWFAEKENTPKKEEHYRPSLQAYRSNTDGRKDVLMRNSKVIPEQEKGLAFGRKKSPLRVSETNGSVVDGRMRKSHQSQINSSAKKSTLSEGDRLYNEIMEKLNKERNLKGQI